MSKNADLDTLIGEALDNIRDDRKLAREFLNEIANQIASDADAAFKRAACKNYWS